MERELQRLSWKKVKQLVPAKIDTIFVPIGTIEPHGPNALGTDNFIPEAVARLQAERLNALIAPTLNYGITRSMYHYPGAITIRTENFIPFVTDIFRSLLDREFKYIFVLNGHGGNNAALKQAAFDLYYERKAHIGVVHWWQLAANVTQEHFGEAGGHGGLDETACVQAIDPKLVDKDEYDEKMAYFHQGGADVYPYPGSIGIYTEGEGYPNFNLDQAKAYLPKMADAVGDFIQSVLEKWKWVEAQ
jgi:creatinine amidohydrolase